MMKRVVINLALCIASILAAIGGTEFALRYTTYGVPPQELHSSTFFPRFYHKADPINGHDIAPNFPETELKVRDYFVTYGTYYTVSSNELGCRDEPVKGEAPYILLLGDSFAWGQVPFEHGFGTLVEHFLGVRVLKCGVSGYGTRHERHKLERAVEQVGSPRAIIAAYFVENDLTDDYLYPKFTVLDGYLLLRAELPGSQSHERQIRTDEELLEKLQQYLGHHEDTLILDVKSFMTKHSRVYNLIRNSSGLRQVAFTLGLADPPPRMHREYMVAPVFHPLEDFAWLEQAWNLHLVNLQQLKQTAEIHNARLLFVIIPTKEQVYEYLRPATKGMDWEYPNRRLREFFEKEKISYLDLLPQLRKYANTRAKSELDPREDLYWPQDGHFNIKGNRLTALLISRYMLEQSFIDVADRSRQLSDVNKALNEIGKPSLDM
jgi:hypothetical protein